MNISDRIVDQFPEFISQDHPDFMSFVHHYYQFLESGELKLSSLSGDFVPNETVTGSVSGVSAKVRSIDLLNSRIFVETQNGFIPSDIISGDISLASGTFVSYTPNPVQTIDQLLEYRDIDTSVNKFFNEFRKEFMATIPNRLANSLDKNNLIKNINDLYKSKGTTGGHKLFFKILFNEFSDIYYPATDLLKPSDGDWIYDTIIRVEGTIPNPSILNGSIIYQLADPIDSSIKKASATIELAHEVYESGIEFNINKETIHGLFIAGQIIRVRGSDGVDYSFKLSELPVKLVITNPGQHYVIGEEVKLNGFQFPPIAKVSNISIGVLTDIDIIRGGNNYGVGDQLVFTNTGRTGFSSKGAVGTIEALGGTIRLEDSSDSIIQEEYTVWASGIQGNTITQEDGTSDISDIHLEYGGQNYDSVPSVTITSASGLGESEEILPVTKNVGSITEVDIFEPGFNYTPPSGLNVNPYESLLLKEITGVVDSTIAGQYVTSSSGGTGQIVTYIPSIQILKLRSVVGTFNPEDTISINSGTGSGTIHRNETSSINIETGVVFNYPGKYLGENGFVSSFAKRMQDSKYYQDYSYVVKIGRSINYWKEELKQTIHPVGFNLFGEVNIVSLIPAGIKVPTFDCTTYTPELFSTFNIIFEGLAIAASSVSDHHRRISRWDHQAIPRKPFLNSLDKFKFAQTPFTLNSEWDPNGYYDVLLEAEVGNLLTESGDTLVQQVQRWLHPDTALHGGHIGRGYSIKFFDDRFNSISDITSNPFVSTNIPPTSEITVKKII